MIRFLNELNNVRIAFWSGPRKKKLDYVDYSQ